MEYAVIRNGVVGGVVVAESEAVALLEAEWDEVVPAFGGVGPGWGWDGAQFIAPPAPPAPPPPEPPVWQWYIDIGPFYDRFGAAKMAVLTSTDAGLKAILSDLNIRKWVDLKRADVAQALAYVGSVVPAVTPALQDAILNTPVADIENLALRRLYFSA